MNGRPFALVLLLSVTLCASLASGESPSDRLVVHEWGTFTTLQDGEGRELYGINIDDEPVPSFVHNLEPHLLDHSVLTSNFWQYRQKAAPRQHPQVTMRLETPVIYFYPPAGAELPIRLDVEVRFRGGWLTEFYPSAKSQPVEHSDRPFAFRDLSPNTVGYLAWKDLKVGPGGTFPETKETVWLAPRKVASTPVTTPEGESEQYLFYRGVARQRAPLRVRTTEDGSTLELRANFSEVLTTGESDRIDHLWLVETSRDGSMAFRRLDPLTVTGDTSSVLVTAQRRFGASEFDTSNRHRLEQDMHRALVAEGLFADEATALLTTWQRAYFASPGLRLFFTVPRRWTDRYLPLSISGDPAVTRVMIGRVELISDTQAKALQKLSKLKSVSNAWISKLPEDSPALAKLQAGRMFDPQELGVELPPDFRLYLDLGRFRNALVVDEEAKTGNPNLTRFMNVYGLERFRWQRDREGDR